MPRKGRMGVIKMRKLHNSNLTSNAKTLRKNMTEEERKLWYKFLKTLSYHVSRQKVLGNYIVDFYCASSKVIIELDGSQHYEEKGIEADKLRDKYFSDNGFKVLRYSNLDINSNFENVCEDILYYLNGEK